MKTKPLIGRRIRLHVNQHQNSYFLSGNEIVSFSSIYELLYNDINFHMLFLIGITHGQPGFQIGLKLGEF